MAKHLNYPGRRPAIAAGVKQSRKNGSDILWLLDSTIR